MYWEEISLHRLGSAGRIRTRNVKRGGYTIGTNLREIRNEYDHIL